MQNYLADLYFQEGQLPLAEGAIREALQTRLSLPVAEHSLAADDFIILAKVLSKQGKHREAFEAGNQGLGLFRKQSRADDKFIGHVRDMVEEFRRKLTRVDMEAQTSVPRNGRDRDRKIRDEPL